MVSIEVIIYYIILIDSIVANIIAWCCAKWYKKNYKKLSRYLPLTKAWSLWYLVLVLWIGYGLYRLGILPY